ncbi:MAG: glycosyltransferase 87 family protein [Chloroflexota bacterium]
MTDARRLSLLLGLGCISALLYEWLDTSIPLLSLSESSHVSQVVPWAGSASEPLSNEAPIMAISASALHFTLGLLGLAASYRAVLALLKGSAQASMTAAVFAFGALFQIQQLDAPSLLSSDAFSYLMYGRIAAIHGDNPYAILPSAFPGDPVLPYVYWDNVPSFYGPIWTLISMLPATLGGESVGLGILAIRVTAALAALGSGALIWLILRERGQATATTGAALWLWNPLLPLESGLSGHNDATLVVCILGAVYCMKQGCLFRAGGFWIAAAYIKIVGLLLLPVAMVLWLRYRSGRRQRAISALRVVAGVAVVTLAVIGLGRWPTDGSGVGALGTDTTRYTNSLQEVLLGGLRVALGESPDDTRTPLHFQTRLAQSQAPLGLWSASGGTRKLLAMTEPGQPLLIVAPEEQSWTRVYVPSTRLIGYVQAERIAADPTGVVNAELLDEWQRRGQLTLGNRILRGAGMIAFAVLLVVLLYGCWQRRDAAQIMNGIFLAFLGTMASWVWPWYLMWPLAFSAISPGSRTVRLTVLLSLSSLLLYPLFGFQGTDLWWAFNYRALAVWVVPLLVLGVLEVLLIRRWDPSSSRPKLTQVPLGR